MYKFLLSRLIPHNTELTFSSEKNFDLHKTQFFNNVLKTFKFAAIRTSLPRFEVSRDVDSGTRALGCDLSDLKKSGNFASEVSTFS